ncbi:putative respiratory complex assembly protein rmp1 [Erysiphe necator]|uniref:Putative respiratory complex assembly protein rmp1 n=1 Tax=Uncinula necator TaxID=52586 RepID=A0A0B1P7C6_UNCNE|nr:putative respiratory complex assembly protein rmp1 [Erysiphe necator]
MGKHEVHSSSALSMNPLISKARKPKFELTLKIHDLVNVPLVTGTSFVKWHLPTSTAAEHRGRTDRAFIREHKVVWKYKRVIPLRLIINKHNKLQDCMIHFDVVQDYSTSDRSDKITLGKIELNLAEYVNEVEIGLDGEESVIRRYLMQESKINSTLKVGIRMKQIDGDVNFLAPPLKTANMFGGISGIMAGDQEGLDDNGHIPTSIRSRDQGEMQDLYRQILAASGISKDGHPPADECIEDIFNGGDGWSHNINKPKENHSTARRNSQDRHARSMSHNILHKYDVGHDTSSIDRGTQRKPSKANSEASEVVYCVPNEIEENSVGDNMIAWKMW